MSDLRNTTEPDDSTIVATGKVTTKRKELFKWQIRIFALSWLAYAAFYFPRQAFSSAKIGILDEGFLTRHTLGLLDSAYLAAYAVGQFVWGAMTERFGTRVVVGGGMVMAAIAAMTMGIAPAVWLFLPVMIIQGLSQSTGWSGLSKNIASFFTLRRRGRAMGLFSTSYAFGGLVAAPVTGSAGTYAASVTVPSSAGRSASLKIAVTDQAGSTLTETIRGAFLLPR